MSVPDTTENTTPSDARTAPSDATPLPNAPDPNPVVAGYRVGAEMGQGPLGKIYRAENVETGEKVVFRGFTRPDGADSEKWDAAKEQFRGLLEQQQKRDRHPVIQDIIGFGEENGLFWIATEYFEARTLQQIMASGGAQPIAWCVAVMKQVADAVDFAAEQGLAHTDLTPYNVLLVNHPEAPDLIEVRVINFGLAHARPKYGSRYAAPEQQDGFEGDHRSDVYAVGALLLELVTGKPIFTGTTPEEIAQKARADDPLKTAVSLPSYARNVLGAMLAKEPRFRYSGVGRAIEDLDNKRSPDGADRFDGVEMNTAALLGEQKLGRKQTGTAEDALRVGWRDAEDQERARQEGAASQAGAAARPAAGRNMAAFALGGGMAGGGRAALQEYRLSEMDLLEIKWKAEQAKKRADAAREISRERWQPTVKWGILAATAAFVFGHGATVVPSYQGATVVQMSGKVTRQPVPAPDAKPEDAPKPKPLVLGQRLSASDLPLYIATPNGGSATLALANGEAIYIAGRSAVEVRELGYDNGPLRRVILWNGRVAIRAQPAPRGKEQFSAETGEGVKCDVTGDTRLQLANGSLGQGVRVVLVAAPTGTTHVEYSGGMADVKTGERVLIRLPGGQGVTQAQTPGDPTLAEETKALAAVPSPSGIARLLSAVEENTVLPIVEGAKGVLAIPWSISNGKNIAVATASMQALCSLMATTDSGAPESLDTRTLAPLTLPEADRKRMLDNFEGGKLVSYRTLPSGGYEILARAKDTSRTWIRGKNGGATTAGTGSEPRR